MIYQFKVILMDSEKYPISMEIYADQSFLELHEFIQRSLGIPPCMMASFFVTDPMGRKKFEVSQVDMGSGNTTCYFMRRTRVRDLVSADRPFINYTFDFINDRSLLLELTGINMEKNLREAKVRISGIDSDVQVLQEVISDDYSRVMEQKMVTSDYGVTEDYFEVFGDIDELTL